MRGIKSGIYPHLLFACLLLMMGGCSSSGPVKVQVVAQADARINRDEQGRPLSVLVRMYQLKSSEAFGKLTFDVIASGRDEGELLGKDLIARSEMTLVPGGRVDLQDVLQESTQYVGVVAFLRRPDPNYWRVLVDAREVRRHGLSLKLSDCYLRVVEPDSILLPGQPAMPTGVCPVLSAGRSGLGVAR
ncbi:MAG: type VI secretion system lipoprotein TssJ [Formivibrio sp.]|nr:type VI secretion system lipoprotein TssJ [Formivibrio sp.]